MYNINVNVQVTITDKTDLTALRQRIANKLRELANPVREDEGITTVNTVKLK